MSCTIELFHLVLSLFLLLLLLSSETFQLSLDALTLNQPLRDGNVLVSSRLTLGFFSPGSSRNRHVGVWYNNVPNQTVVWVANRDNPVNDSYGVFSVNVNGGLVIHGKETSNPIWSANVTLSSPNNTIAKLTDTGNLVLIEKGSQVPIWEGFDYPTNVLLPFMKLGYNKRSKMEWSLTSWKSQDDPGIGNYSYGIIPHGIPQFTLYRNETPRWRNLIGFFATGKVWSGSLNYINNQDEVYIVYVPDSNSAIARTFLDGSGILQRSMWNDRARQWNVYWSAPIERCDMYGQCGPNGNCNPYNLEAMDCLCLPGYEPKSPSDWYLRDGSGGCLLRKGGVSICGNGEGFVEVKSVKIPDMSEASFDLNLDLKQCEELCLKNCSCMAYSSSDEGNGCVTWPGGLMDIRTLPDDASQMLYVRVDAIVLAQHVKKSNGLSKKGKVIVLMASAVVLSLVFSLGIWLVRRKRKRQRRKNEFTFGNSIGSTYSGQSGRATVDDPTMKPDLPFFDLTTVAVATNNFSSQNKLGAGGFGSVYKFKSLDLFIFNESDRAELDWTRRFEIIYGIVRGILYLHQDSRLRIIHRDLKASNILLDASMNPKIADFGMARIFKGDQNEANTKRVVGTYGYMSPEYAMQGRFSVKSDVYSFGILLLEIITGRKNKVFYQEESSDSNLVEYVWNLWREDRAVKVVDLAMEESYSKNEVLRCIHIALLCVQEHAIDRPTMSAVLVMLGNDATLASPKEPAFLMQKNSSIEDGVGSSVNDVTCSMVEAR